MKKEALRIVGKSTKGDEKELKRSFKDDTRESSIDLGKKLQV